MIHDLLQPTHLLVILAVALFVFGPKKLPQLARQLGKLMAADKPETPSHSAAVEK